MSSAAPVARTALGTRTWLVDPVHSVIEFAVKHMMVATVKGRFRTFEGKIELNEEKPEESRVEATIDTASIDTAEPQRDAHLRSPDFFDVERFPTMTFHSTKVELLDDTHAKITGDLTVRDITREVVLDVGYEGQIRDAYGKQRAALSAETVLNRKDFGLNWNQLIETGGLAVGDKVRVMLNIAAVRQE